MNAPTNSTTTKDLTAPIFSLQLMRERSAPWNDVQTSSPKELADLMRELMRPTLILKESFWVVALSTNNTPIGLHRVSEGGLASSIVEPRSVLQFAILANAASFICVHNHPSGNPEPSREDIRITRRLADAGRLVGIVMHDHIIVTEHGYTSLAERGVM